jgi:uncharacterized membrane protein YphA (DoxX/SURF4 family)
MNGLTRVMLVLLRLAIGWHFLFEGLEKIESVDRGPTTTNRPWTSEPYLREASGPLGGFFREQIGDLDELALARLTVEPLKENQDPARTPFRQRIPPALEKDWDEAFQRFVNHYGLTEDQLKRAQAKFDQTKDQTVRWLLQGSREVDKTFASNTVKVKETTPQRIQEYRDKLREVREGQDQYLPAFEKDVWKERLRVKKAEVARLRTELLADVAKPFNDMLQGLELSAEQKQLGALPPPEGSSRLKWMDRITRYGLTAVGACLLLGLFTRTACVCGAAFLLLFYLTMPALPWVPEVARSEGHYLFINKNLIEMLALLALATTRSGQWVGLDGLLRFLNPRNYRTRMPARADNGLAASVRA